MFSRGYSRSNGPPGGGGPGDDDDRSGGHRNNGNNRNLGGFRWGNGRFPSSNGGNGNNPGGYPGYLGGGDPPGGGDPYQNGNSNNPGGFPNPGSGPSGDPHFPLSGPGAGYPVFYPYPYPRSHSPQLMKLQHITKDMYFWNGDTSQLRSYIRRWDKEFSKHSPNIVVPFIRTLVPEFHQWRLNKARTFQDCVDCLMVLVSSEDVYVQKLEAEIRAHPKCRNLTEDKEYLNFLSMKVAQLLDIQPNYVVTSAQCTGFFSKIHCSTHTMNLNTGLG